MKPYNFKDIEAKWQQHWEASHLYKTPDTVNKDNKLYILPQLPYPSGSGLHVGHAEVYTACDIYARAKRMQGHDVLQVIGWDSFGLPAENYAIKNNVHPKITTNDAIDNFRYQIKRMGISVDWSREVGSHNPDYYKWTQWFFLLMYNQGLAYRKKQAVNWCDGCKTVLANEQVVVKTINNKHDTGNGGQKAGKQSSQVSSLEFQVTELNICERCGTEIVQKEMEQWFFKITEYADRLYEDLDKVDWPKETVTRQRNWIGKSKGIEIKYQVADSEETITCFTTRPDTNFGATFIVLAPEHPLINQIVTPKQKKEVEKYLVKSKKKTELERMKEGRIKTGVFTGAYALNNLNNKKLPIWVSDFVLGSVGTGAVVGVPGHDRRDFDFAKAFNIPVEMVVQRKPVDFWHSFLMGAGRIQDKELESLGIQIVEKNEDGALKLVIPRKEVDAYLQLVREKLEPGYWNEVVGDQVRFIFKEEDNTIKEYTLDSQNKGEIAKLCSRLNGDPIEITENIWAYLGGNSWYTDLIVQEEEGTMINSEFLNGLDIHTATEKIMDYLEEKGWGKRVTKFKLRDWSISRQRFWGAPIPMIRRELDPEQEPRQISYHNKPTRVVNIHAWGSNSSKHFHPWLEANLKAQGIESRTPDLPHAKEPVLSEWLERLEEELEPDTQNTVITGRSLGVWAALKLAEKHTLRKVICMGPTFPTQDRFKRWQPFTTKSEYKKLKAFVLEDIDYQQVQAHVGELVFYLSMNDPYIDVADSEAFIAEHFPFARVVRVRDAGHFDSDHGYSAFPKLLEEITRPLYLGVAPLQTSDLPVLLPDDVDFMPTGQSPLNYSALFQEGVVEQYGKGWKREVDTLDTFMCSSWYYYRYIDPHNDQAFASPEALKTWMPVDFYIGGPEHTNGHLLYSRFFTKVLYDAGYIDFDEPFRVHRHQGLILGEDNHKMSKRWGNVINPTDVMDRHGADVLRLYEMFMGPLEATKAWNTRGEVGILKFLQRIWNLQDRVASSFEDENQEREIHRLIQKVTGGIERLAFNTTIARFMEFVNFWYTQKQIPASVWERFLILLAPFAPHITEELWDAGAYCNTPVPTSIHQQAWPSFDPNKIIESLVPIVIQINGKLRASIDVEVGRSQDKAYLVEISRSQERIKPYLEGKTIQKEIVIPGKLVNFVVS